LTTQTVNCHKNTKKENSVQMYLLNKERNSLNTAWTSTEFGIWFNSCYL